MPSTSSPVVDVAGGEREAQLERLERLADWLDSAFRLSGTNIRFGLDSLFGLIPGLGDTALALPSLYVLASAQTMGAPWHVLARMLGNIAVDWAVGIVPLIGDIFDVGFKSNKRNVALLRRHFGGSRAA